MWSAECRVTRQSFRQSKDRVPKMSNVQGHAVYVFSVVAIHCSGGLRPPTFRSSFCAQAVIDRRYSRSTLNMYHAVGVATQRFKVACACKAGESSPDAEARLLDWARQSSHTGPP